MSEQADAWRDLQDKGAAGLVGALMEASRVETDAVVDSVLTNVERERDEWKDRALRAERTLALARSNLERIFYPEEDT